jgi:hypothetical protein
VSHTARELAAIVDDSVAWVSVRTADSVPGADWVSCAEVVAEQQAGGDPTYGWRKRVWEDYARQYDIEPPVVIAGMVTLMWYVQVPSLVAGVSAAVTGMSPDVSPASLAFRRHPSAHYPFEIALLSSAVVPAAEAAAQFTAHTTAFLESYKPEVKLGSLQRFGAVKDELRAAIRMPDRAPYAEEAAAAFGVSLEQKLRTSCCYFYALPNINACTTCPRFR